MRWCSIHNLTNPDSGASRESTSFLESMPSDAPLSRLCILLPNLGLVSVFEDEPGLVRVGAQPIACLEEPAGQGLGDLLLTLLCRLRAAGIG